MANLNGELLQAQAHIWNHLFNFINSFSLKCAVELGIPDIIHKHGAPMTTSELLQALPIINKAKSTCIPRLMHILVHSGFFIKVKLPENNQEEGFLLTPASRLLLKDEPLSVRPFIELVLDPVLIEPWHMWSKWFKTDDRPNTTLFEVAHGIALWEYAAQNNNSNLNHLFNEGMASDARLVSSVVISDFPQLFQGIKSMVDVGGGTGTMGKAISEAYEDINCVVLDLPHVVHGLQDTATRNLTYVEGDMFHRIPPADAVLLKFILHDWSDQDSIKILKKCKEAIPSKEQGGKVIIIDMVLGDQIGEHEATETQLFLDMQMMVQVLGKERNEQEWAKLFSDADFNDYKITKVLGLRSVIEVYP